MTIEVRQLLIRSRVGSEEAWEQNSDTGAEEKSADRSPCESLSEALVDELDEWRRQFANTVNSPRER